MRIQDNVINEIFRNLEKKSNYKERYLEIKRYNKKNKFKKRV